MCVNRALSDRALSDRVLTVLQASVPSLTMRQPSVNRALTVLQASLVP